jgi:hypothetical protein
MSAGQTQFFASKIIAVTADQVSSEPTSAQAWNYNQLTGIQTRYDSLPLVASLIRSQAQQQYRAKRAMARAEVEFKVADEARGRLESKAEPRIDEFRQRFRTALDELDKAGIDWEKVELRSTDREILARLRVAGEDQLAAHTPRAQAPRDSLASLQCHESTLNNVAATLDLNGRRLTAAELRDLIRDQFPRFQDRLAVDEGAADEAAGTVLHFDLQDAVQTRLDGGRVELIVSLAELVHEGRSVRDFKVHAFYRPEVSRLSARLVRTGALGIEGRVRTSDRARLHAVFNKVFADDRPLTVVSFDANQPGFADLMITQFVLEDGWLGLAVGPAERGRTAQLLRSLR